MKSRILWCAGGLAAFLFFLLAYLPAQQVIGRITLPANIAISGVSGTLWEGRARTVVANGLTINNTEWQLSPWSLLIGNLSGSIKAGNIRDASSIAFQGPFSLDLFSMQHVESENFLLYLPVDRVLAEVSLPLPVNAGGRFKVSLDSLSFGPACESLTGTGDWLNATVAGTQGPIDFGSYNATLRCEGEAIGVEVKEPNMLGLSMDAVIQPDFSGIRVSGKVKPDDSLPDEVHQAARFFGQPDASGYIPIQLD
ncbi:type II secretion system protein N [Alteromonas halophila]|uniref:Type II secretion system protein N n=1 Tax=Alteromonas halophila TaxID=516698 RepID=A0A918MZQ3_9ALTE|nr:type II secretion system protein N [Alteromonas halophila]GGW90783.1 type II secretion protein N [Alteromonas halophila]